MARILALCLLLIGLATQLVPVSAKAMPAMHHAAAMQAMADCPECNTGAMTGHDACEIVGGCATTALLDPGTFQIPFDPGTRGLPRAIGGDAAIGARPAPPREPPRLHA